MTITVHGPSGITIDFPDGTDHATINGVMSQAAGSRPSADMGDIAASGGSGVVKGVVGMAGLPGDAGSLIGRGVSAAGNALGLDPEMVDQGKALASSYLKSNPITGLPARLLQGPTTEDIGTTIGGSKDSRNILGKALDYTPQTTGGEYVQTAGEFLPAVVGGPEGIIAKLLGRVAVPAVMSETAGQMTKGTAAEPWARLVAAVLGGPAAMKAAERGGIMIQPITNPAGYAERGLAKAIVRSGQSGNDIESAVLRAASEGQPDYTVADALQAATGRSPVRSVTGSPGAGRTDIMKFLEDRQTNQSRDVATALAEGFQSPKTAKQVESVMTSARDTAANTEYGAVRSGAANSQVDVVPTLNNLDRNIGTKPGQVLTPANDSIEAVLTGYRQRLERVNPDDFEAVSRLRGEMADEAQTALQNGKGNRARLINQAVRELDTAMEKASPGWKQANANFSQRTRNIEAIDTGRAAANRGRPEDTIPSFQALPAEGQQGFRAGYVDPLIEKVVGAPRGVNKARDFTGSAFQQEAGAMAPGNDLMQRRLSRSNTMFETRAEAMGGSKTDMNLADAADLEKTKQIFGIVGNLLAGKPFGALGAAATAGKNVLTGNTEAVRAEMAKLLLRRATNMPPGTINQIVNNALKRKSTGELITQNLRRLGGAASVNALLSGRSQ
jgi:hypothetical protein